jgi:D-alanyl-D-alanine carboxypeptidase
VLRVAGLLPLLAVAGLPEAAWGADVVKKAAPAAKPPPPYLGPPRVAGQPAISAAAAVLVDGDTGEVLWSWKPDQRMYPASLTKMMSGLVVVQAGDLDRTVTASKRAARTGESSIALVKGEQLALRQVLQASLINSANDATVMMAEAVGGSVEQFVAQMNAQAAALGMAHSHFTNPHGLHNASHYSTARDLGLLAWECMRHPDFAAIVGTRQTNIPRPGKPWQRRLVNRNRLLLRWPQCDGIKTGYTKQAGRCLAASATGNDWRLICVVLKCRDSWEDAHNLLTWGFRHFQRVPMAHAGAPAYRVPVHWGVRDEVVARAEQDLTVTVATGQSAPQAQITSPAVSAPVAMGQPVGWVSVRDGAGRRSVRLLACEAVSRSTWGKLAALSVPQAGLVAMIFLAAGVLLHGAGAKTTRTRRRRLATRKRETDRRGPSDRGRGRGRTGEQG